MRTISTITSIILALAAATPLATAHETWAERVILIHYGEPGGPLDPYKPEQIRDLSAIGTDGAALAATGRAVGGAAIAIAMTSGDPAAVFYTMDLGHYAIVGDTWTAASPAEAAAAERSWNGTCTTTSILAWHAGLASPRNRAIEIVPSRDPGTLPSGQPLVLQIYRHGRPQAGFTVHLGAGAAPAVSDADGRLSVPVRAGHQVIMGTLDLVDGGRTTGLMAALSFTRP